jgi:hypothetical protein
MRRITSKHRRTTSDFFTTSKTKSRPLQAFANLSLFQAPSKTTQRKLKKKLQNKIFNFSIRMADFKNLDAVLDLRG